MSHPTLITLHDCCLSAAQFSRLGVYDDTRTGTTVDVSPDDGSRGLCVSTVDGRHGANSWIRRRRFSPPPPPTYPPVPISMCEVLARPTGKIISQ
ncbi:hypothetical protein ElyMa_003082700 [Elysia marginata]|uniref:Uncharacterized protein n=1 Tax=Elysia marginata TaxID=1093978 RepID=A0AAV4IN06_9GAST|nr:hypothetical protein ElyMa_003082700 [Elysia marginata]